MRHFPSKSTGHLLVERGAGSGSDHRGGENKDMTFEEEDGKRVAKVAVYGIVTSITNRVITEFDDDMLNSFTLEEFPRRVQGRSIYQKIIPVERKMRYKIDLVVKDMASGNLSVIRKAIVPPRSTRTSLW